MSLSTQKLTDELIHVYLIARISKDAHCWSEKVVSLLRPPLKVFLPHKHNPWNSPHEKISRAVFETDFAAMQRARVALILPDYGRDCAYEVGWFHGLEKPVVCYVDSQVDWLRDWMVKGGITTVATDNAETLKIITADPFFQAQQIRWLAEPSCLHEVMIETASTHRGRSNAAKAA